jgi:hypothetical protein
MKRIAFLLVALLLLAACGSQAGDAAPGGDADRAAEGPAAVADESGGGDGEATGGGPDSPPGLTAPIEQRIIKTGEIVLEVDSVATVLAEVRGLATALGGYVGSSQSGTLEESATVTLRVPAVRFEELLVRLREVAEAEVVSESTSEQDVTGEIVDLRARIDNLEASESTYRVLLERAERIDDVLAVQSRLDEVRGQIEQLEGQLATIEGRADLSTLTVTLIPRGEPVAAVQSAWDPGAQLESALAALVGIGQGLLDAAIWLLVVWIPVLGALALVGVIVWRVLVGVRRRLPAPSTPPEAEPMR